MAAAVPIEKDGFVYKNHVLYAESSDGHQHPRASLYELNYKFNYVKKDGEEPEDLPGHWYECQLKHYGLYPLKDKDKAKERLVETFNNGRLGVPERIQRMELEMMKEWSRNGEAVQQAQDIADSFDSNESSKKGAGAAGRKTGKKRKSEGDNDATSQSNKKKATKTGTTDSENRVLQNRQPNTSRTSTGSRKGASKNGVEDDSNKENSAVAAEQAKDLTKLPKQLPDQSFQPVPGVYHITNDIPDDWEEYENHQKTATIVVHGKEVWGFIDFGMFSGVIRTRTLPTSRNKGKVAVHWRAKEHGEEENIFYDRYEKGRIRFGAGGTIWGELDQFYGHVTTFKGTYAGPQTAKPTWTYERLNEKWLDYCKVVWMWTKI